MFKYCFLLQLHHIHVRFDNNADKNNNCKLSLFGIANKKETKNDYVKD